MTIYIIELCLILFLGILYQSKYINKKIFIFLSFTIMALVLGLRGIDVGEDTNHYIDIFNYARDISWKTVFTSGADTIYNTIWGVNLSVETGYIVLNKFVGIFTSNGQWFILISAILTCILIGKFIYDNSDNAFFATYIFMCEGLYMQSFNLLRQMLAIAVALQAYKFIRKERYKKAVVIILIAFFIHKTSALFLLLVPLQMVKKQQRAVKYVTIVGILVSFLIPVIYQVISQLIPRYASYLVMNYWESNAGIGTIMLWITEILICGIIYYKKIEDNDKDKFITVACTILYLSFELIGLRLTMFSRVALVFRIFLMFLFPLFASYLSKNTRLWYKIGLLVVVTLSFLSYASADTRLYSFFWQRGSY